MYLGGRWYAIDISKAAPADSSRASSLDVALLQEHVLERLLKHRRHPHRQADRFRRRRRGTRALEQAVGSGRAAVAFSMYPVMIEDLCAISDSGGIMPPKSTWFEPKLRDGLLVHLI